MFQEGNTFGHCIEQLKKHAKPKWFAHELIQALFKTYWPAARSEIIKKGLLPFLVYFFSVTLFNYKVTVSELGRQGIGISAEVLAFCGPLIISGWAYFMYQEFFKLREHWRDQDRNLPLHKRIKGMLVSNFSSWFSFFDFLLQITIPWLYMTQLHDFLTEPAYREPVDDEDVRNLHKEYPFLYTMAFAIQTSMWIKMFDWLRISAKTAIYPMLIREILRDVGPFVILMLNIFCLFGSGTYIFTSYAVFTGSLYLDGIEENLGVGVFSAMIREILLMVGEFHYESFF